MLVIVKQRVVKIGRKYGPTEPCTPKPLGSLAGGGKGKGAKLEVSPMAGTLMKMALLLITLYKLIE